MRPRRPMSIMGEGSVASHSFAARAPCGKILPVFAALNTFKQGAARLDFHLQSRSA